LAQALSPSAVVATHKLKQYINYYNKMKTTSIACGLLGLALAAPAYSQTVIDITGATAFRSAAIAAIRAKFQAGGNYQYAHDAASNGVSGANKAIFKGTFQGLSGTTVVRCSWNGSVEGIRALVDADYNPEYYQNVAGNFVTAAASGGGETHTSTAGFLKSVEQSQSEIAFSDVTKNSTPFASNVLQPSTPQCGVVVFTMLTNEGSTITNVTSKQFRALFGSGSVPLSLFTGVTEDESMVYAVGRNDGSGTRTAYLAETGYGITNTVTQYLIKTTSGDTFTALQKVPAGGVGGGINDPTSASTVWAQDVVGNGGYFSGSVIRGHMSRTGANVNVYDADGTTLLQEGGKADLVTWITIADAATARAAGAVFCAFNGVRLDGLAASGTTLSVADKAKVTNGAYTAWGYQQMYARNGAYTGSVKTVYDGIKAAFNSTTLGSAGIPVGDMAVGREEDGGVVAP
jgi:hypothetical protein